MGALNPAVAATRLAVRSWLSASFVTDDAESAPPLVLVACSGGADSLALAAAVAFEAPRAGVRAGAVVIDHGLLEGSAAVAERAAQQCMELGLAPVLLRRTSVAAVGGPEGAAREARLAELAAAAGEFGARWVLLAHTADDQAETVLLRLARGSGGRSLAGIPPARGLLGRPLLALRRAELREACRAQGLQWWEDPANAAEGPLRRADGGALPRAAIRGTVLPALAAALDTDPVPALARTAELLREDADLLDALAAELLAVASSGSFLTTDGARNRPFDVLLDVGVLADAPAPLRRRALRQWLVAAGAPAGAIGLGHVVVVDDLVMKWRGQRGVDVPGDLRVRRRDGTLEVVPRAAL